MDVGIEAMVDVQPVKQLGPVNATLAKRRFGHAGSTRCGRAAQQLEVLEAEEQVRSSFGVGPS